MVNPLFITFVISLPKMIEASPVQSQSGRNLLLSPAAFYLSLPPAASPPPSISSSDEIAHVRFARSHLRLPHLSFALPLFRSFLSSAAVAAED